MTYARLDNRVARLEGRVADIETSHGSSIYDLTRRLTAVEIVMQRSFARLLQALAVPEQEIAHLTSATDEEVDTKLEESC
ncbi:hypothetical protein [Nocardia sp. NPDC048505]|uniref:hypothetical protein n=1 Tax=unclassified Nocardia TaxID=2637762 RepID=UPI0033E6C3E6